MTLRCPKCKSDNIQKTSRRKYLLRAGLCLAVILACLILFVSLLGEDLNITIMLGLGAICIMAVIAVVMAIIYLVKGIRTKQTLYYCNFCDKSIATPLMVEDTKAFDALQQIRRN